MDILREDNRLYLHMAGARVGRLDFVAGEGRMRIGYVGVDEAYRGQGLARRLVEAAVRLAREEGWKIVPLCPYARAVLLRDKAAADVLADGRREDGF